MSPDADAQPPRTVAEITAELDGLRGDPARLSERMDAIVADDIRSAAAAGANANGAGR
jgi:hypothetical protein